MRGGKNIDNRNSWGVRNGLVWEPKKLRARDGQYRSEERKGGGTWGGGSEQDQKANIAVETKGGW